MEFNGYYNAKLLLSGEYLVLKGAQSLAVPLRFGQSLHASPLDVPFIHWKALTSENHPWFLARLAITDFSVVDTTGFGIAQKLSQILNEARNLNPSFCSGKGGFEVVTKLNYPIEWGLGSSSALIAGIAGWADVDPFRLHFSVSKGSGYDIACATAGKPLLYSLQDGKPVLRTVDFMPPFAHHLYFVYQGKKMDSAQGIREFDEAAGQVGSHIIDKISELTNRMLQATTLEQFESVMSEHEHLISRLTGWPSLRESRFSGFRGEAKSLGAWGGDFCMITWRSDENALKNYLQSIGLEIFFSFADMILQTSPIRK